MSRSRWFGLASLTISLVVFALWLQPIASADVTRSVKRPQPESAADATTARRVAYADLDYLGAFRAPEGDNVGCNYGNGEHCFTYG